MSVDLLVMDAFTTRPFTGNPAGIVLEAGGLSEGQMQKIAREVNASETAFVIDKADGRFSVRYFTPQAEVDFCGHATIAVMSALAQAGHIEVQEPAVRVTLSVKAGDLQVELRPHPECPAEVVVTAAPPEFAPFGYSLDLLAGALGVSRYQIPDHWPLGLSSVGGWTLVVPITSKEALDAARPDFEALARLNLKIKAMTTFLYTWQGPTDLYARCFAPAVGIFEDPVTGTGMAAAAALIVREKAVELTPPCTRLTGEQGTQMGRTGLVGLEVDHGEDGVERVRFSGTAVQALRGKIQVPV